MTDHRDDREAVKEALNQGIRNRVGFSFERRLDQPGEGMGLAYAQMAVRQCGGEIQVASKLGRGTTFQWTLPVKPGQGM